MVEKLLVAGAKMNAPADAIGGRTALKQRLREGRLEVVKKLLRKRADINALLLNIMAGRAPSSR